MSLRRNILTNLNTIKSKINKVNKTIKKKINKHAPRLIKRHQINRKIEEIKNDYISKWGEIWRNSGRYINDDGAESIERQVGYKHQNMGAYLKKKKNEIGEQRYKQLAIQALEEEARNIRWRAIVERANFQTARRLRREASIYQPGVEMRLEREGLSRIQIEEIADLNERSDRYRIRAERAPIILREILDEADRRHEEMMSRIQNISAHSISSSDRPYSLDDGEGNKRNKRKKVYGKNKTKRKSGKKKMF